MFSSQMSSQAFLEVHILNKKIFTNNFSDKLSRQFNKKRTFLENKVIFIFKKASLKISTNLRNKNEMMVLTAGLEMILFEL